MVLGVVHYFFGFSLDELGSIILIASTVLGTLAAFLHHEISTFVDQTLDPINDSIKTLNKTMVESNEQNQRMQERLSHGDKHFIHHDEELKEHTSILTDHEHRIRKLEGEEVNEKHNHNN